MQCPHNLLNSVHFLLSKYPGKYKFAVSGSSARKLKRLEANLLAGRLFDKKFFPLNAKEISGEFNIDKILKIGLLPLVWSSPEYANQRLLSYVNTYLKEEIQQEAQVNDIGSFNRFLKIASILNGTTLNYNNIARDTGVSRKVVERYFSILIDTLIAFWLPAWKPRASVKEVSKPKFYFFDTGIVRACSNRLDSQIAQPELGTLLETYILHELRSYINHKDKIGELSYWRSSSGSEIDIIWSKNNSHIGIEVKSSKVWKKTYNRSLKSLLSKGIIQSAYGIYLGSHSQKDGEITIYTVEDFINKLWEDKIF